MQDLLLEFHLPDFLLPEGWGHDAEEDEVAGAQKLGCRTATETSLLAEDTLSSFSHLSSSLDVCSGPFPCLADELEQQAKALEREWYCPEQPLTTIRSPRRPAHAPSALLPSPSTAPALKHSDVKGHLMNQEPEQIAIAKDEAIMQKPLIQAASSILPTTPTKRSQGHNSSWNESQCVLNDPQEVQSPARPLPLLQPLLQPTGHALPPLSLAVDNAESVRFGQQPVCAAAWRGCGKEAWCNREARHRGPCNHRAAVPGLMAYSERQLFESGVNVEELCRAPKLAGAPKLATGPCVYHTSWVSAPVQSGLAPAGSDEGSLRAKRRPEEEAQPACPDVHQNPYAYPYTTQSDQRQEAAPEVAAQHPDHQQQVAARYQATSCPDTLSGQSDQGSRAEEGSSSEATGSRHKRQCLSSDEGASAEVAMAETCPQQEVLRSGDHKSGVTSTQPPIGRQPSVHTLPFMPEDVPNPRQQAADAVELAEPGLSPGFGTSVAAHRAGAPRAGLRSKAGGRAAIRMARPSPSTSAATGSPAAPEATEPAAVGAAAHLAIAQAVRSPAHASRNSKSATPSKPLTKQLPKTPDAINPVVRTGQRRVILHWNSDQVVDPRTGNVVCHVEPASFCTQCFATHTPVWRAGPFGHKTLCNACGVRYMKYSKSKK